MENIAKKVNLKRLGNTKEYLKGLQELKKRAVQELHKNYSWTLIILTCWGLRQNSQDNQEYEY